MTTRSRAELALAGTTFIWGGTFAVVKLGMRDVSPILLIAIRFAIASVLLLIIAGRKVFPLDRGTIAKGMILALFLFLGFAAQNIGLTITTASKSAFITGMMVLFVPFFQYLIERRAPKVGNVLGILVVCGGLWLLTAPEGSSFNLGDALTVLCAIVFAVYIVYLDVVSNETTTERLLIVQLGAMTLYSTVAVLLFETPRLVITTGSLLTIGYLTILATLLTTWVQTRYQKETTPTRAAVIFSVEPVIASAVAYVILKETLGIAGIIGGALTIVGVLISEFSDSIPGLRRSLDGAAQAP